MPKFTQSAPRIRRTVLLAASALTAVALVTACESDYSSSSGTSGSTGAASQSQPAQSQPTQAGAQPGGQSGQAGLATATAAGLGAIVTDNEGRTLYRFDKDTAKPPVSNCNGACATTWPPVMAGDSAPELKGIDKALVSTVTRADGSKQVTLNGWPVYRYAPDTKPGDTKGQGVNGTWFVITPTGGKAGASAPASPAAPATSPAGGYGY
ncbi:hypothetical protein [Kitasatospora camelliae]|uniref:Lipoprotein with Yx(FWY)xxD motif n=1 Tax=Kitasatospora camelliae TaxID=3156397 RepID=A0AAU8JT48_9ACTN